MLSERERDEVVAAVARDLGVAVSPTTLSSSRLPRTSLCSRGPPAPSPNASLAISRMPSEPARRSSSRASPKP